MYLIDQLYFWYQNLHLSNIYICLKGKMNLAQAETHQQWDS